ncbi:hypothetical protein C8A00DRAFT_18590 [Chaetomidium leptoderma]|uniref:Uncharacterized protein n=1 Tax=Chaetomidium leptoderma TaxID=669021 RepID=A0AAN6VEA7_9PEZI|nr:hypothetical protein C8A00DRAFT_18590 [Chaetomidium leptoderma]
MVAGVSPNYRGDVVNPRNLAADIPPELNCSLFVTNLPGATTVKILLQVLASHGPFDRIYACHVTEPDPAQGFTTASAKITTFSRPGAERLYSFIAQNRLVMNNLVSRVIWNRNMVGPQPLPQHYTRVLCLRGPKTVVDGHVLFRFLQRCNITFHTQDVFVTQETENERAMVWQFGSYRAQAEAARAALQARWPAMAVQFGPDPCATGIHDRAVGLPGRNVVDRNVQQGPLGMIPGSQ